MSEILDFLGDNPSIWEGSTTDWCYFIKFCPFKHFNMMILGSKIQYRSFWDPDLKQIASTMWDPLKKDIR